jgi:hypothetical protein
MPGKRVMGRGKGRIAILHIKKAEDAKLDQKLERGRFAERLDAGFVIPSRRRGRREPRPIAGRARGLASGWR